MLVSKFKITIFASNNAIIKNRNNCEIINTLLLYTWRIEIIYHLKNKVHVCCNSFMIFKHISYV